MIFYLSGTNLEDEVAPIPGRPCLTGLYANENSDSLCPIISGLISTCTNEFPLCTPTTPPIISGTITTERKCVLTVAGFSPKAASFFYSLLENQIYFTYGLSQLLEEVLLWTLNATVEVTASTLGEQSSEFFVGEGQKLINIDSVECELLEL